MPPKKPERNYYKQFMDWIEKNNYWTYLNYAIGTGLSAFLLLLIFGGRLGIFDYIGFGWIMNSATGVYADCSKAENQHVTYCQPKKSAGEQQWDNLNKRGGKSIPFNLHDN